jgi:hypothetical protein
MKALTLTQPYATLVAIGAKRIETRSWRTRYRGPLAIHAGKGLVSTPGERGPDWLRNQGYFMHALRGHQIPRGVIVATCILMDCAPTDDVDTWNLTDEERAFGNFSPGRYGWFLANITPLDPPIPATGRQGLWEWTESEVTA